MFTCFSNVNENIDTYAKIETVLKDINGKIIAQTLYDGTVSFFVNSIIQTIIPEEDISDFSITTTVYDQQNNIIDQIEKKYNCKDINVDKCIVSDNKNLQIKLILIISLIILTLIFILYLWFNLRKNK